jgi:hypothetical protein
MRRVAGSIRPDSGEPSGPIAVVVLIVEMMSDVVDLRREGGIREGLGGKEVSEPEDAKPSS